MKKESFIFLSRYFYRHRILLFKTTVNTNLKTIITPVFLPDAKETKTDSSLQINNQTLSKEKKNKENKEITKRKKILIVICLPILFSKRQHQRNNNGLVSKEQRLLNCAAFRLHLSADPTIAKEYLTHKNVE